MKSLIHEDDFYGQSAGSGQRKFTVFLLFRRTVTIWMGIMQRVAACDQAGMEIVDQIMQGCFP